MNKKNDFLDYERPSLATDLVLFRIFNNKDQRYIKKTLQIKLVKRKEEPFKNQWSLPGALVNIDQTITDVLKTKVCQKSGYENIYFEQLYTFDALNRDPRWRVIGVSYIGILNESQKTETTSDYESKWFSVTEKGLLSEDENVFIPYSELTATLAFDHGEIISTAVNRLRNKLFYTDIAFHFINEVFTIRELQDVFEAILNKKINNFRRTVKDKIVETNEICQGQPYRPAKLYKKS